MNQDISIEVADAFYEAWLDALHGKNEADALKFNAMLVLMLANQIRDKDILLDCIKSVQQQS